MVEMKEKRLENSFPTCLSFSSVKPKERSWGAGSNEVYGKCGLDLEKHYHCDTEVASDPQSGLMHLQE